MRYTKKFLVLLLEIQKIKKNAQNNSGIVVSWSLMFSWGDKMRQGDTKTSRGVSWSLGGRGICLVVSWTPGDPFLTIKRHHEIFGVSWFHSVTRRPWDTRMETETMRPLFFSRIFLISVFPRAKPGISCNPHEILLCLEPKNLIFVQNLADWR